jgi:hypothetical protein
MLKRNVNNADIETIEIIGFEMLMELGKVTCN